MLPSQAISLFLERIPDQGHMLCFFASNARRGHYHKLLIDLASALAVVDAASPGYAATMLDRIAAVSGTGEDPYESILQLLGEIYVVRGMTDAADRDSSHRPLIAHEPGVDGHKNPECEAQVGGYWCAIEVKTPSLLKHSRQRGSNAWQMTARLPQTPQMSGGTTKPRDNPVKDFLISADAKFASYESFRAGAIRILIIVWDDFCNEPISALLGQTSGLLTANSFYRDSSNSPITFPNVDGLIIARHQHQLVHATRCEPLVDSVVDVMQYEHIGFPPKAFIAAQSGRVVPRVVIERLNALPLDECLGAEYIPGELIMWFGS